MVNVVEYSEDALERLQCSCSPQKGGDLQYSRSLQKGGDIYVTTTWEGGLSEDIDMSAALYNYIIQYGSDLKDAHLYATSLDHSCNKMQSDWLLRGIFYILLGILPSHSSNRYFYTVTVELLAMPNSTCAHLDE